MTQLAAWLGGLAIILIPGAAIVSFLPPRPRFDEGVALATTVGLGLSFWPLLFLWTSTAGLRWNQTGVRFTVVALAILTAIRAWRLRQSGSHSAYRGWFAFAFVFLFALTVATRLLHIRGIVLPLWVDSVHHTMVIRLLLEHGMIPNSYEPFIPHSSFYYHWGFHITAAALAWLTGCTEPFELVQLILGFGQLLNALVFVVMYAAGRVLFGTRAAGLLTATFACLVSYFPAYYVSWGRYTHLAGVLLLPPVGISLYRVSRRRFIRPAVELALLSAALILIHVRIAIFAATLGVALLVALPRSRIRNAVRSWASAVAVAALITSPWLTALWRNPNVRRLIRPPAFERVLWETPNQVPADLLWAPNNVPLMVLATAGTIAFLATPHVTLFWRSSAMIWWSALAFALQRRWARSRHMLHAFGRRIAIVVVWSVVTIALINSQWVGLPRLRPLPNSAAIITMFVPLSLMAAGLITWFIATLVSANRRGVVVSLAVVIALIGASTMRRIINPATLLATEPDVRALRWIRDHTALSALFAVGVQPWLGSTFVGIDGGYWISVLTDRRSILPPGLYTWSVPPEEAARINHMLVVWAFADSDPRRAVAEAQRARVTHAYFGPNNDSNLRRFLAASSEARTVYADRKVTVFEIAREPVGSRP